jgi:uncharacterized protein YfaS (alpha-2-macroglobulin family)
VRFKSDVVPVEVLEAPDRQSALAHFSLEPALPGHFIFLTPRMVAFEPDSPIPDASRVRVVLGAGLADLAGHTLAHDFIWSFTTTPLTITSVPGSDTNSTPAPMERTPKLSIGTSVAVDLDTLVAHAKLVDSTDKTKTVALEPAPSPSPDPSASAGASSDASGADTGSSGNAYTLVPTAPLAYDRTYKLVIEAGVQPAAGNVATTEEYDGSVRTYGMLKFGGVTYSGTSRFASTSPSLTFSNPITQESAETAISLSPSPAPSKALVRADYSGGIDINPDALEPDTSYTATIATTLTDTFGQTLDAPVKATFRTGDLSPNLSAPYGSRIFPAGLDLAIQLQSVNLPENGYRAGYRVVKPADLIANDLDQVSGIDALLPDKGTWTRHPLAQKTNVEIDTTLPLRSLLGGSFGTAVYGFTARTTHSVDSNGKVVWEEPESEGAVEITNLGVFSQWFPDSGLVRVHRLDTGAPVPGATVEIYESFTDDPTKAPKSEDPCASGTTGSDGTWRPEASAWAKCASTATSSNDAPQLLTVVHSGQDWAYDRTSSYENGYESGLSLEGWSAGKPNAGGSLISDRSLYQPGETAKFVGISYFETDGTIGRGRSTSFDVIATSPSGATTDLGPATPDGFGAFSVSFAIPKTAPVGSWQLTATGQGGEALAGAFTVAEFKPPNFKVDLTVAPGPVPMGTAVPASSTSLYLFGAPVQGGTSHVAVTRARSYYAPDGYEAYAFGRQWTYPEEEPSVTSAVMQQDVPTDANGAAAFSVNVDDDLPYPMTYTVSTQTTDVSNLAVADTKTFVALPSDVSIGLKTSFLATENAPFDVDAIALGLDGKPVSGRSLKLVLQQRVDASATQVVEGSETDHQAVRYVDVATQTVSSGSDAVHVTLTAPKPGDYRVRANFADASSEATATDATLWVTGAGDATWISPDNGSLGVKLDKTTYRPGDVAHVLVQSPYPDAEMYLAVERHGVILQRTTLVHGAAPEATFTVTKDMLPNAAVQAILVRRGPSIAQKVPKGLDKLSRIGFASFEVALDAKYLAVDVKPATPTVGPGGHEKLEMQLRDSAGKPVAGELTVAVVNESILQLTGYRFPDLVKSVYADQVISTRLGDNYSDVKLQNERSSLDKGFGFGGGVMAGPASTRVRTKFLPLAYWNAAVHTDANGKATVDVPLPDDLTTWHVLALALTKDARFGNGETTFIATKALVTDPILPQFARPGDTFSAGVSVTNVAHADGDVSVAATMGGGASFATGDPHAVQTTAPAQAATQALRFDVTANGPQDASFTVHTGIGANTDAFTFGVPILSDDILESAITTGATTSSVSVPVAVSPDLSGPLGGLDVTLASTLLAEALEPTRTLAEPHDLFGVSLASRIAVASDAIVLDRTYGRASAIPALQASISSDLAALRTLALPDGGFAEWRGQKKSEPYATAFIVQQLLQARGAGISVDADLAHATHYLHAVLADPFDTGDVPKADVATAAEMRLEALETLGAAGEPRTDFLSDVWTYRATYSYFERVELARFLLRVPAWKARGIALRDELFTQVNLGARHATVDDRGDLGESETAGQAQMLGLAIAGGTPQEDVDRVLESLLQLRHNGRWGCSCDDAEAMNALVLYAAQNAQPPDFVATATVPSKTPQTLSHAFKGYAVTTVTDTIPMDALARGSGTAKLTKTGRGTLHYAVALRYRVPDAAPGAYQGLRIDRIVRVPGTSDPLLSFGLAKPTAAATLGAAHVFDIEDRIVVDHPVENVVITDPLPAGFEAVDATFATTAPAAVSEIDDNFTLDYQSIYKNHVLSFASHLDPGSYEIHYLVRSVTPGTFAWPGATVQLQYEPEAFGRTAATQLVITP